MAFQADNFTSLLACIGGELLEMMKDIWEYIYYLGAELPITPWMLYLQFYLTWNTILSDYTCSWTGIGIHKQRSWVRDKLSNLNNLFLLSHHHLSAIILPLPFQKSLDELSY